MPHLAIAPRNANPHAQTDPQRVQPQALSIASARIGCVANMQAEYDKEYLPSMQRAYGARGTQGRWRSQIMHSSIAYSTSLRNANQVSTKLCIRREAHDAHAAHATTYRRVDTVTHTPRKLLLLLLRRRVHAGARHEELLHLKRWNMRLCVFQYTLRTIWGAANRQEHGGKKTKEKLNDEPAGERARPRLLAAEKTGATGQQHCPWGHFRQD